MKGLGFITPRRWPTIEEFVAHSSRLKLAGSVTAIAPVTLGTPTILDQGEEGSCGGEAIVQAIHIADGKPILSPAFPYWCARREDVSSDDEVYDSGIDPFDMVTAIEDFGACPEADMPYDTSKANEKPGAMAFSTAQKVRARMLPILEGGTGIWPVIQHVLSVERLPVFIGIEVVPSFDNVGYDGIVDDPRGISRGGHAICGFGWDQSGLWIANSWGIGYGKNGTACLSPRYLAERCHFAASVEVLS